MVETASIGGSGNAAVQRATEALKDGKHVVFTGSGVSPSEEVELKKMATERELLFLGPGCSTSILDGEGFGIWNSVSRGAIGIIGTFGSGIQQVSCLLDDVGVSHVLDVGFRDLSQSVNAVGTKSALKFLKYDEKTEVIVLLARSPVTSVRHLVLRELEKTKKPTVVCLLDEKSDISGKDRVQARSFRDAADHALAIMKKGKSHQTTSAQDIENIKRLAKNEYERFSYSQKYVRGLYSGGALCTEALTRMSKFLAAVHSNLPLKPRLRMPDPHSSRGNTCIDLGTEKLSGGINPIVNLVPKCARLKKEAKNWNTAVVLLDIILGHGAHPNPAAELIKAIKEGRNATERAGGYLSVTASIIGTPRDPQNQAWQRQQLEKAGVLVSQSNAQAAEIASLIATKGKAWKKLAKGL